MVVEGVDPLPTRTHHFIGADRSQWKRNLAVFRGVRMSHLHPGIHVEHYRGPNGLEHDYIVDPGADPERIRFAIEGGSRIDLDANGDLVVHAGDNIVRFTKPVIYQQTGQDRDLVDGRYVRGGPSEFGFHIENYDTSRPLIIDPVLSPPTVFGGSDSESLRDVDVDNAGNIYVTGSTRSADFPTMNPLFPNISGETDVFIAKFDPTAQNMIWATFLGGSEADSGLGLAVGAAGDVYVVGSTWSPDFPLRDALQPTHGGKSDAFAAKLNTDGDVLEFSTFLGGAASDFAQCVEVDLPENIYICGETISGEFPTTAGALSETLQGEADCFVSKMPSSGQDMIYSTFLGGAGRESCSAIALTPDGEVAIVGASNSMDFPTTPGAFQPALDPTPSPIPGLDLADAVAAMLAADGSGLLHGGYYGGAGADFASAVAIDPTGGVWVGGGTDSPDFPVTPDADQAVPLGDLNGWIARFDPGFADANYVSFMRETGRMVDLLIMEKALGIDFEVLTVLIEFLDSFDRLTILALLTPAGAQISATPVDGAGVTSVARTQGGAVLAGTTNAADAGGTDATLLTVNVNDEPPASGANLDISKTADPAEKVAVGGLISYTVKVFNQGPEPAENVEVIDTLPSISRFFSNTMSVGCEKDGGQVTCNLKTVAVGGNGRFIFFEVQAPEEPGTIVNTASVSASNAGPTSPAEVSTEVEVGTDVGIKLTGPDEARGGQVVTFTMKVINYGPLDATNVRVVFPIHPAIIKLSDILKSKGECEQKEDPNPFAPVARIEVLCELPLMKAGEEWDIEVVGEAGSLEAKAESNAEVRIQQADTNRSNNSSRAVVRLSGDAAADVVVRPVLLLVGADGSGHTVVLRVDNNGPSAATNVQLTVEPGVAVLSELLEPGNGQRGDCGGGESCTLGLGTMSPGGGTVASLAFNSNAESISIIFRVAASEPDPDPTNNLFSFQQPLPKVVTKVALGVGSAPAKLQTLEQPVPILPPPAAVTNSAAGLNFDSVSAGSGHTVWGTGFSSTVRLAEDAALLPIHLEGVKVRVNGIAAPLVFVAGNQINFQTPWELLRDTLAEIRVEVNAATTMPIFARVAIHDPGIYTTNQSGSGQGAILIANTASLAAPAGMFRGSRPAARGDFISIFCTGLGPVDDPPPSGVGAWTDRLAWTQTRPTVTIDGLDARTSFWGLAPGFVALYQVNARVPGEAATGDAVDLSLEIGGVESNGVTIAISE